LRCPFCASQNDKVINSRTCQEGEAIRRRRECQDCMKRFTTFEYIEAVNVHVIKRNGARQTFDPRKIRTGIWRACEKRPITEDDVETIIKDIEREIQNRMEAEIHHREIGELVLQRLRNLDQVAYVRFASVYRAFRDVSQFEDEAKNLQKESAKE